MALLSRPKKAAFRDVVRVLTYRGEKEKDNYGLRGEILDKDDPHVKYKELPISYKALRGRELEQAREVYAMATHRVECLPDPKKPLHRKDILEFCCGRRWHIGDVLDIDNNGVDIELLVGESVE